MIAIKLLYNFVKSKIDTITTIKHFDWWNSNVANERKQTSYPTPAVFFEMGVVAWQPSTKGSAKNSSSGVPQQQGVGSFTLHIIHKKIESSARDQAEVSHLDHVEAVFKALHFAGGELPFLQGPIQRLQDEVISTHSVLRDWPMVFSVALYEAPEADADLTDVEPWAAEIEVIAENVNIEAGDPPIRFEVNQ
jgi:hypothetical protein